MTRKKPALKIAVCGSAAPGLSRVYKKKAQEVGRAIAESGCILFTGATLGFSYEAVKGARSAEGMVVGISPAESEIDQFKSFEKIDPRFWSTIIYTGVGYKMRDVVMIRSVDAAIYIGGGVGTLLEMATAVDYQKVMGVLVGSGGATELTEKIAEISHRYKPRYVFEKDSNILVKKVIKELKKFGR